MYFAGTLYWITDVMTVYGGLARPVAMAVHAMLVAYLALFPAAFAVAMAAIGRRLGSRGWLLAPAVWVTTEAGRATLLTGFPWVLLGYSQADVLPVAQLASLGGVYALSGLVAFVGAALARALVAQGRPRASALGAALAVVLAVGAWGAWRLRAADLAAEGEPLRVGLIQGNIAQEDKWNPALGGAILERYLGMTREAAARGARLVIWPESATPFYFEDDAAGQDAIRRVARETGAHVLLGSDEFERGSPGRYYNAAFLVTPAGETAAVYRKMHLVPFGEYVPLRTLLFFAEPLVDAVSDFSPGDEAVTLPIGGHRASTVICYEVIYPDLVRRFVDRGSELLTTITNDAWFGRSSAPHQHFQQAALRAVEQGRYLARAANTGISGIVDPYGRALARSALFVPEVIVGDVRLIDRRTVYGRIGDLVAWIAVALTAAALLAAWRASG